MSAAILFALAAALQADPPPAPVQPPKLPDAAKIAYWKARALTSEARAEQIRAEGVLAVACGSGFTAAFDAGGDLVCSPQTAK